MKSTYDFSDGGPVSELAIVDTFTKLIFGEEDDFNNGELSIIQALRSVDTNVTMDAHRDMGEYLRALGVEEMVQLVSRVQETLVGGVHILHEAREDILKRRAH